MQWWALYGELASAFGWTYREIDELTMPEWNEIQKYLAHNPPLYKVIGDYFGVRKQIADETQRQGSREELKELARRHRGGF